MRQKVTKPIIHMSQCLSSQTQTFGHFFRFCVLNGKNDKFACHFFFFSFLSVVGSVKWRWVSRNQKIYQNNKPTERSTTTVQGNNNEIEQKVTPFGIMFPSRKSIRIPRAANSNSNSNSTHEIKESESMNKIAVER